MQHLKSLDGLRAVAVLLVLLTHFGFNLFGWFGVEAFFVLSAYLITDGLLDAKKNISPRSAMRMFFLKRALRIFPLYFGYLILISVGYLFFHKPQFYPQAAPLLWTFTYNLMPLNAVWHHSVFYSHFWTLAVEIQFYLIWPFVVYFCSESGLRRILCGMFLAAPLVRWILSEGLARLGYGPLAVGDASYWFTLCQMDALAGGAAAALLCRNQQKRNLGWILTGAAVLTIIAGMINDRHSISSGFHVPYWMTLGYPFSGTQNYQQVWSYSFAAMMLTLLVMWLVFNDGLKKKVAVFFSHPVLVWLGKRAYGIYVYHSPWLFLFGVRIGNTQPLPGVYFFWFVLYFLCVVATAQLSYRFWEEPFLNWKNKLSAQPA